MLVNQPVDYACVSLFDVVNMTRLTLPIHTLLPDIFALLNKHSLW